MVPADGRCRTCGGRVPETNTNKFYCSEPCREQGWAKHHPGEPTPDWDAIRAYAAAWRQVK